MDPPRPENNLKKSFTDHNQSASARKNIPPSMLPYIGRTILPTFTASPPDVPTASSSYCNGASAAPAPSSSHAIGVPAAQGPPASYVTGASTAQGPPSLHVTGAPAATASSCLNASYMRNIPPSMLPYIGKSVLPTFTAEYIPPSGPTALSSYTDGVPVASGPPFLNVNGASRVPVPISPDKIWSPSPQLDQLFARDLNIQAPLPADAPNPTDESQLQQNGLPPVKNASTPGCITNKKAMYDRQRMLPLMLRAFRSTPTGRMVVKEIYDYVLRNCRPGEYTRHNVVWERNVRYLLSKKPFFHLTGERKLKAKYWRFSEEDYREAQGKSYRAKFAAHNDEQKEEEQNQTVPVRCEDGNNATNNINNGPSSLMHPPSIDNNTSPNTQQYPTRSSDLLASGTNDMQNNNPAAFSGTRRMPNSTAYMNVQENLQNYASNARTSNSGISAVPSATHPMMKNINSLMLGSNTTCTQGNPEYWSFGTSQGNAQGDPYPWTMGMNNDSKLKNSMPWNAETFNYGVQGSSTPLSTRPTRRSIQNRSKPQNIGHMLANISGDAKGNPETRCSETNRKQVPWNNYNVAAVDSNSQMIAYDWMNQMPSINNTSFVGTPLPNNSIQSRLYDLHSAPKQYALCDQYNSPVQNASFDRRNAATVRHSPYNRPCARVPHASRNLHNSIVQHGTNDLHNSFVQPASDDSTVQHASYDCPSAHAQHASYNSSLSSAFQQGGSHDMHNTITGHSSYNLMDTVNQSSCYGPDSTGQRSSNGASNISHQCPTFNASFQNYIPNASDQPIWNYMQSASGQRPLGDGSNTLSQSSSFNAQNTLLHSSPYDASNTTGQHSSCGLPNNPVPHSSNNVSSIPVQHFLYDGLNTSTQQSSYDNTAVQRSSYASIPSGQNSLYSSNLCRQRSSYDVSNTESAQLSFVTSLETHEPGMHPDGTIDFSHPRWTSK